MPYLIEQLHSDIAQIQRAAVGFGSGRLIAKNMILTAAHTLCDDSKRIFREKWQVRLNRHRSKNEWPFTERNEVVWYDEALDLALIEIRSEKRENIEPRLTMRVASVLGNDRHPVEALGFPRGSIQQEARETTPVVGRLSVGDTAQPLIFGIESYDLPDSPADDWPGMSGACVAVQDHPSRKEIWIYGVVRSVPAHFSRQLRVARLSEAWKRPDFRRLLVAAGAPDMDAEDPMFLEAPRKSDRDREAVAKKWKKDGAVTLATFKKLKSMIKAGEVRPEIKYLLALLDASYPHRERIVELLDILSRSKDGEARPIYGASTHISYPSRTADRDILRLLNPDAHSSVKSLLPLRFQRMQGGLFSFFRGSVALMAYDLIGDPHSGILVQSCGDCNHMNFSVYPSIEGAQIFDIYDYAETFVLPFEWDLKRLCTGLLLSAEELGMGQAAQACFAERVCRAYRQKLSVLADLPIMDVSKARIVMEHELSKTKKKRVRKSFEEGLTQQDFFPPLRNHEDGTLEFEEVNGSIFHQLPDGGTSSMPISYEDYFEGLDNKHKKLLDPFSLRDAAFKVIGVGSIGLLNGMWLLTTDQGISIVLEIRQVIQSCYEEIGLRGNADRSSRSSSDRVVEGQRLMQAVPDPYLCAKKIDGGRDFYVRAYRDGRLRTPAIICRDFDHLDFWAELCAKALACAHSRSHGQLANMASYTSREINFDQNVAAFALRYAKTVARDAAEFKTMGVDTR